jgi:hypothetical protein
MNKKIVVLAVAGAAAAGLTQAAHAQNIVGSTTASTAWASGTAVYQTGTTPTNGNGGTTQDNAGWGGTGTGVGINGQGSLGMLFEVNQTGTLSTAQLTMAGSAATFNVELYNLGAIPSGYPAATIGNVAVTSLSGVNSGFVSINGGAFNPAPNLLQAGDQFTFNGVPTGNTLQVLTFQNLDAGISLNPADLYMLALDPQSNSGAANTWWQRGGVPIAGFNETGQGMSSDGNSAYQNFEGKGVSAGVRDMDLNITESVPEPATLGLLGMASLGLAFRRRKIT